VAETAGQVERDSNVYCREQRAIKNKGSLIDFPARSPWLAALFHPSTVTLAAQKRPDYVRVLTAASHFRK
jgi:hypothetical protein